MPDENEPTPPPASPYGPAEALAALTGDDSIAEHEPVGTAAAPAPAPSNGAADTAAVERGRRILRVAALITGTLSIVSTIVLIVLGALGMGTADNDLIGVGSAIVWTMVLGAPVLIVIAINLVIWRALLRGLARRPRGEAIVFVVLIVLGLAVVSVILVTALLFLGFFVGALSGI